MMPTWPKVPLTELLQRAEEIILPVSNVQYRELTVRLWGRGVVERGRVDGASLAGSRRYVARTGQFIASRIDARNGAMGIVPDELDGAVVTNDFPLFNLRTDRLVPSYFGWLSRTRGFVALCQQASEGTTNRVRLKEDRFLALHIPLPPLVEQRRVVARIEELAAQIKGAHTFRAKAVNETEALGMAYLRAIILGCQAEDIELESVCEAIIDNFHSNPTYALSGIPCIRSSDVGQGTLNLATALRTDEAEYLRRTARGEPQADDIVFVREGGGTGKCALVLPEQRFSLGQRVMILRPNRERIVPRFFLYQLLSPLVQDDQIIPLCKGSASPHLNIGSMRRFHIRLPPPPEQHRMVAKLDGLQAELGQVRRLQAETAAEIEALLPSILDSALKGDL